jgi:hypothetical protein
MNDYKAFLCPNNSHNQQQHSDLEDAKANGWRVIDAAQDGGDPNIMVITLSGTSGAGSGPVTASKSAKTKQKAPTTKLGKKTVTLDARPDPVDFRDQLYVPTLVEVPSEWPLEQYLKAWPKRKAPVLDQGQEGACTGFGLAAVAHYLLCRRKVHCDRTPVSPRMFYEMARRYDEWDGENYSGSSARGAMKGWHKHGVCSQKNWPYKSSDALGTLTPDRALDALQRPLGAYFRVNHRDLVAMHSALAEVGILYATSTVHEGWGAVGKNGIIKLSPNITGGHAFAIVGYDNKGFWLQNSWDTDWGRGGFAHLSYDDWLQNGSDVWVARLGAPVFAEATREAGIFTISGGSMSLDVRRAQLQQHTIAIGNEGRLRESGEVGNTRQDVERIFAKGGDFETLTKKWKKKRILLYAHGGLVSEKAALQRVAEYLPPLLDNEIYPLAFIWKTDLWATIGNMLKDLVRSRRPEGPLDRAKDFLLDRLDDTLELVARVPGKAVWGEMKENAGISTADSQGGGRIVLEQLTALLKRDPSIEVHFCGHSAGSIFLGPIFREFCAGSNHVTSLNLWAPACTMEFFKRNYVPALNTANKVRRFNLFTLKDAAERDDNCAKIYNKSLLYLVANACEVDSGLFWKDGAPLLGMERFILDEHALFGVDPKKVKSDNPHAVKINFGNNACWVRSPNNLTIGEEFASAARHHGDFDDDDATVSSTLAHILGLSKTPAPDGKELTFRPTASGLKCWREELEKAAE